MRFFLYFCSEFDKNNTTMKKFFYLFALVTAMTLVACGAKNNAAEDNGVSSTPEAIQQLIAETEEDFTNHMASGMTWVGTKVEGKEIIFTVEFDESDLKGYSFKDVFEMSGMDEAYLSAEMRKSLLKGGESEVLRENEYDVAFLFVGSISKEEMRCKVAYTDF